MPPIQSLDAGLLYYPGEEHIPTILSQKQFKTTWEKGGEMKNRVEQWIRKETLATGNREIRLETIGLMVLLAFSC